MRFYRCFKITIGEPRPDMLARCAPSVTTSPAESLLNVTICNGVANIDLQDGFKSFPSGHSSCKWNMLIFMGFYNLNRQLGNWHSNILPSVTRKQTCYFPHSAAYPDSFAGLGFLSLYLCGKLHIFDHKGHVWKSLLVMIPIMGAILVAISRIMDYRHHPWDVIFGSLLGKWKSLHLWI